MVRQVHSFFCVALCAVAAGSAWYRAQAEEPKTEERLAKPLMDEDIKNRLSEAVRKMNEMETTWEKEGGKPFTGDEKDMTEEQKKARKSKEKAKKEAEKAAKEEAKKREERANASGWSGGHSDGDSTARVRYGGYGSDSRSGWTDIGGVSRSTNYNAGNGSSSVRESGNSGTSISVRSTVIPLDGPKE